MQDTIIEPLSGWPNARLISGKDDLPAYGVTFAVLTPWRALVADGCVDALKLLVPLAWLYASYRLGPLHVACALLGLATLVVFVLGDVYGRRLLLPLLGEWHEIVMATDRVSIRHGKGWIRYPRQIEHRFELATHDAALWEQRWNEARRAEAGLDRKVPAPAFYYADSFHVVLKQAGQRRDLLTVFGPWEAQAILARLQYIDRVLDAAIKMGGGVPNRPEDDWDDAPGGMQP